MSAPLAALSAALLLGASPAPEPLRATKPDKFPRPEEEPVRPGAPEKAPSKRTRIFGIGVGFERSGTLSGVALNIVLADSPAYRAGLLAGCIISEINGEQTAGRSGEECARLIRDGGSRVRLKFLDPAMKERAITLEKEWIVVPE